MKARAKWLLVCAAGWLGAGCIASPPEPGEDEVAGSGEALTRVGVEPVDPPVASPPPPARLHPPIIIPNAPIYYIPSYSDLQLDGIMRYYEGGGPTVGLQIDVTNRGNGSAYGPSGRVRVAGLVVNAALYQYNGTATNLNTLNPNEHGYLKADVPASLLSACHTYEVQIDLDHNMQAGDDSVFANDWGNVTTICPLGWATPIDALHLGHAPDPLIAGKTLQNIVSSVVSARANGQFCSDCHNSQSTSPFLYKPNVAPGVASSLIDPYVFLGTEGWAVGGNTWADQFNTTTATEKPDYLREAFQKWIKDGRLR